jgi:hypothetical protein
MLARSLIIGMFISLCLLEAACAGSAGSMYRPTATRGTLVAGGAEVALLPRLGAGQGGWCVTTIAAGACPTLRSLVFSGPIISEEWTGRSSTTTEAVDEAVVLTTSSVAAVSLEGSAPYAMHGYALPDHLRGIVIDLRGTSHQHALGTAVPLPFPTAHFTALSSKGQAIRQTHAPGPPLGFAVPARTWGPRARQPAGVCSLHQRALPGLVSEGGGVMTVARDHPAVRGREFVDCLQVRYLLDSWPLEVDVLLDAAHPGSTPALLPEMHVVPGHRGLFQGPTVEGEAIARRVAGAWLIVSKGEGQQQRLSLLEHLRANVQL